MQGTPDYFIPQIKMMERQIDNLVEWLEQYPIDDPRRPTVWNMIGVLQDEIRERRDFIRRPRSNW